MSSLYMTSPPCYYEHDWKNYIINKERELSKLCDDITRSVMRRGFIVYVSFREISREMRYVPWKR